MDKEYQLMEIIGGSKFVSQRELSEKLDVSLGTVNILLKKMIREGLLKIEKIPKNRVIYMLTSKGMKEKLDKTYSYIKNHYNHINITTQKLSSEFLRLNEKYECIVLYIESPELLNISLLAIKEVEVNWMLYSAEATVPENSIVIVENEEIRITSNMLNEKFLKLAEILGGRK